MQIPSEYLHIVSQARVEFWNWVHLTIWVPLHREFGLSTEPPALKTVYADLTSLEGALSARADGSIVIPTRLRPTLKRALLHSRELEMIRVERARLATFTPDVVTQLEDRCKQFTRLLDIKGLRSVRALPRPRLSEFMTVQAAERHSGFANDVRGAALDEKFGILMSPSTLIDAIGVTRKRCSLRGRCVSIGYADVDNFKAFNEELSETNVDRFVLPQLMQIVEAHVFGRGYAYRLGGDEYALLLPNADKATAVAILDELRRAVSGQVYPDTSRSTTLSIGVFVADADCSLTDTEVLARANRAKAFAKDNGRNRVAVCEDDGSDSFILAAG